MTKINEHVYKNGLRNRWYTSQTVARLVLSRIVADRRGEFTKSAPLKTSPNIWRVDDMPR